MNNVGRLAEELYVQSVMMRYGLLEQEARDEWGELDIEDGDKQGALKQATSIIHKATSEWGWVQLQNPEDTDCISWKPLED